MKTVRRTFMIVANSQPDANRKGNVVRLPGDFAVWLASPEADFLTGRFVWAEWDVDELIAMKEKMAGDTNLLTVSIAL